MIWYPRGASNGLRAGKRRDSSCAGKLSSLRPSVDGAQREGSPGSLPNGRPHDLGAPCRRASRRAERSGCRVTPSVQSPAFGGRGSGRPPGQSHDHDLEGEGPLLLSRERLWTQTLAAATGDRGGRPPSTRDCEVSLLLPIPRQQAGSPKGRPWGPGAPAAASRGRFPGRCRDLCRDAGRALQVAETRARVPAELTQAAPSQTGQDPTEPFHTHYTLVFKS